MKKDTDNEQVITEEEAKFCLLYVNAPAPFAGDARKCYKAAISSKVTEAEAQYYGLKLLKEPRVADRVAELIALNVYDASNIKQKTTTTLLSIMDECATAKYVNQYGDEIPAASMRSVSVNAAKELNSMYGIKEDIAHKVSIEGSDGSGITFNINVPTANKEEEEFKND